MTKAAELAKIVDASGNVVTSGTVEPAGDTAAGDNAAIGFTSAEGIIITGQGSTNDVTIKNDADADVIEIPTGTTNVTVAGSVTATGFIIGSADINENDLESIDGITAGTVAASKAAIVDTNKDITGFRNITLTGELDAATLDISGDADIDGTLEADAITIGGTAIASVLSPVAGSSSIVTTGALNSGSITSGFGNIDTGSSTITTTGAVSTGALTAASLAIDNISIDGTEIDLSSGSFTIDSAANITLDCGTGEFLFNNGGNGNLLKIQADSSNVNFIGMVQDKDLVFKGNDGGSTITALTLDMSDGGRAAFAHNADFVDGRGIRLGDGNDFQLYHDGSNSYIQNSTNNIIIDNTASDQDIIFKVNDGGSSTETARFDASFDAFVLRDGGGAAVSAGKLEINASGSSYNLIALKTTRTSTGTNFIEFFNSSGTNAGEINHNGSTTVNYSTSSDYRLKENVTYDFDATSRLKQLKPARFNFIADPDVTMDGFLAHEVQSIVPIAVNGDKDEIKKWNKEEIERGFAPDGASEGDNKLDDDGNTIPEYQGIEYGKLVPVLTKALQEAIAKIEILETKVAALEAG